MPKPDDRNESLALFPPSLSEPLSACLRGALPPNIALMQICLAAPDAEAVAHIIAAIRDADLEGAQPEAAAELRRLWRDQPDAFATVKRIAALVDGQSLAASPDAQRAAYAELFDRAAAASPDAGVALYSLGSADVLRAATEEVVQQMRGWQLLGPEKALLEIGCGHGRFVAAIAPEVRHIIGADLSGAMIAAARQRCAGLGNVQLVHSDGRDLGFCDDASVDAAFAADSFPYIVPCGDALVRRHFQEAARILKPGGFFLILNYAYRGDLEQDRRDVRRMAGLAGLAMIREATSDFKLWDAATFLLQRPAHARSEPPVQAA